MHRSSVVEFSQSQIITLSPGPKLQIPNVLHLSDLRSKTAINLRGKFKLSVQGFSMFFETQTISYFCCNFYYNCCIFNRKHLGNPQIVTTMMGCW